MDAEFDVVTGAFGYSGEYVAQRLLERGRRVRTLTNSPARNSPVRGRVEVRPYDFDRPEALIESLRGAAVLYNTYWVRFNRRGLQREFSHASAVENTLHLFDGARRAGVRRVVHVSITCPSEDSPFEYFRGKARLEKALVESGLSYAILRPAVLFGGEDILINNIAWVLRRFPVFGVFGDGRYRLQPIHVEDLAGLAVDQGLRSESRIIDAVGPETFTYRELVGTIGEAIGKRRRIIGVPPLVGHAVARLIGALKRDVVITREEIGGLMAGLLCPASAPTGTTRLTLWAKENAATLGVRYASEIARRIDRTGAYADL